MVATLLTDCRDVLTLYCRALLGRDVNVLPLQLLLDGELGWRDPQAPSTDGEAVYLPAACPEFVPEPLAMDWFRVAATQQLGHLAWGSFDLVHSGAVVDGAPTHASLTELSRFLWSFAEPGLAHELFAVLEPARIEARCCHDYPGLAAHYGHLAVFERLRRPALSQLGDTERWIESILRSSLPGGGSQPQAGAPEATHGRAVADAVRACLRRLSSAGATVADTAAEVTTLHGLIAPSLPWPSGTGPAARPHAGVSYRGAFKPELVQLHLLLAGRRVDTKHGRPGGGRPHADVRRYIDKAMGVSLDPDGAPDAVQRRLLVDNLLREWLDTDETLCRQATPVAGQDDSPASVSKRKPPSDCHTYDEWDYRSASYRRDHCWVRQRMLPQKSEAFFRQTLSDHAVVARRIRQELQSIDPQSYQRRRRLYNGPMHDLDAAVEAQVDRRLGHTPTERVFERKERKERSVAVALLVDLSASTGEQLPPDPVSGATQRIIDVEKQALVLLVDGLSATQDAHAIYGFSGYRASQVDFFVIKDFDEKDLDQVARRIDGIRPQHATRMGAAIRHATVQLQSRREQARFLLVLSDGRPQDEGYSEGGRDRRYGTSDTRMALVEARRAGLVPFCLTVDVHARDYLAEMTAGAGYEVLADIRRLPQVLPQVYRRLTA